MTNSTGFRSFVSGPSRPDTHPQAPQKGVRGRRSHRHKGGILHSSLANAGVHLRLLSSLLLSESAIHGLFPQYLHLRDQETIQETRSGDKSDELRDRFCVPSRVCDSCPALRTAPAARGPPVFLNCLAWRTGVASRVAPRALWWGVWDCGVECV